MTYKEFEVKFSSLKYNDKFWYCEKHYTKKSDKSALCDGQKKEQYIPNDPIVTIEVIVQP